MNLKGYCDLSPQKQEKKLLVTQPITISKFSGKIFEGMHEHMCKVR